MIIASTSQDMTAALGRALCDHLKAGHNLLLFGPIGAGKSLMARAIIKKRLQSLGRDEDIPSPSFSLIQSYDLGDLELLHVDLYRLHSSDELYELGLDEAMSDAISIIEWPQKLGPLTPENRLEIHFEIQPDDTRSIRFQAFGTDHQSLIVAAAGVQTT